jgi:hypothetical protein
VRPAFYGLAGVAVWLYCVLTPGQEPPLWSVALALWVFEANANVEKK